MAISPIHRRRTFGEAVRTTRELAGLSQKQLARAIPLSQAQVSAIERGTKGTTEAQVRRIDLALNADGAIVQQWHDALRDGNFPDWFRKIPELEARSTEIREYQMALIPGVFQTPEYAETVIRSGAPAISAAELQKYVDLRQQRKAILEGQGAPQYVAVLDQPWLHRPMGSRAIMKTQMEHLLEVSHRPGITVQIVPTSTKLHPGIDGSFKLVTVPHDGQYVFTESRGHGRLSNSPEVIHDFTRVFGDLRGVALPEEASQELLRKIIGEHSDE